MIQRYSLEPLSVGQILDRAFRLYRGNFITFLGIVAVVQIPVTALTLVFSLLQNELLNNGVELALAASFLSLGVTLLLAVLSYFSVAALAHAVAARILGQPTGILSAYREMGRSWQTILGLLILFLVLAMGLGIISLLTCSILGVSIFLGIALQLGIPIVVLERQSAGGALRRAWDLVRRRFWWVLGFYLALTVLQWLIAAGPSTLVAFGSTAFASPGAGSVLSLIVSSAVSGVLSTIFLPLQYTAMILMYFDLRVRTEGLDLALKTAAGDDPQAPLAALLAAAPPPEQGRIVTLEEYFWLVGITIIGFVFFFVLGGLFVVVLGSLTAGLF